MLGRDVVGIRLAPGIDLFALGVNVHARAGQGASQHGCVRGEDRADGRRMLFEVQQAAAAHPFMEMRQHPAAFVRMQNLCRRLDDLAAGRAEHHRFRIVPAAGNGVHAKTIPQRVQQLSLIIMITEAYKNDLRPPRNVPAPETAVQIPLLQRGRERRPAGLVRGFKLRIVS